MDSILIRNILKYRNSRVLKYNGWIAYWGELERALHKREVHAVGRSVCLSFCLSVRTFMT